jgi:HPt (histidine-containing phosphotransfer) domain-containing protein
MADTEKEDEFLQQLTKDYLRDMLTELNSVESKISQREGTVLATFGHTLKGSGAMFGFPEISQLGIQIEDEARAENWNGVRDTTKKLIAVIEKLLQ